MWSPHDFPFLKPACSLRNSGSRASEILSRITLLKTLLVIDNRVTPLQFLQRLRSPFFGSLTISPIFQSPGVSSVSHIPSKISVFSHFFSRWWVCIDLQVLFAFWNFCLISWCFLVEDGLEVCFPSLGLFCFTGNNISIHIFHWNITIFKTASQRFGYLVQCGHVLCLCCCFCFICQIFDEGSLICSSLPFDFFIQF